MSSETSSQQWTTKASFLGRTQRRAFTAATDFLSDVDATLAKRDADKNDELTRAEIGNPAWMIFAIGHRSWEGDGP
jgi:hypothetical protein